MIGLQTKLIIVGVLAVASSFSVWLMRHDSKVAKKTEEVIVQRSQQEGAARAKKADQAHRAAKSPGAAERLLKDPAACRDCK